MTKAVQFWHIDEYEVIKHIKNLTLVNTSLDAAITTYDHCATNIIIVKNNVRMIDSSKNYNVLLYNEAIKIKELRPILSNNVKASKELDHF